MSERTIYNMKLHESISFDDWKILRVSGGWIYTNHRLDQGQMNSLFVPFDNEFWRQHRQALTEVLEEFAEWLVDYGHILNNNTAKGDVQEFLESKLQDDEKIQN